MFLQYFYVISSKSCNILLEKYVNNYKYNKMAVNNTNLKKQKWEKPFLKDLNINATAGGTGSGNENSPITSGPNS